ncbi:hypothetical protein D3C74_82250 [compost metagenome]
MKLKYLFVAIFMVMYLWYCSLYPDHRVPATIALFLALVVVLLLPSVYSILWETNIRRLERYLLAHRSKPEVYLYYVVGNELDEEVEQCIHMLLAQHKSASKQALFRTVLAFHRKNLIEVQEEIKLIRPQAYSDYYRAALQIELGHTQAALQIIQGIPKLWMRNALLYDIKRRAGEIEEAQALAEQCLSQVRGLQKYILFRTFQRHLPTLQSE